MDFNFTVKHNDIIHQLYEIIFSSFDYDYGDIYDTDYWDWVYNYNDNTTATTERSGTAQQGGNDDSTQTDDTTTSRRRRKRSTETTNSTSTTLKKTNSASSALGLNILLYQDKDDYFSSNRHKKLGVVQNHYYGYKVQ